jgi:myo-inositol-1(or 4)-monophosphatase
VSDPLRVAVDTAAAVGALLRDRYEATREVRYKGAVDLVTDADLAAEALAVRRLAEAFPDHSIVAEETRSDSPEGSACWYVDPLDGTTNFAHRLPHFAVSLAFAERRQLTVGVVYDPMRDETFTARRGGGAFLNGRPIRTSAITAMDQALLGTGFPYDRRERAAFYLRHVEHFLTRSQGIRRAGCAALDLCFVAAGRLDAFWEWNLKAWDTAAGALIVREAGGIVSDFAARPFAIGGTQILAANPDLHPQMIAEFASLLARGDMEPS